MAYDPGVAVNHAVGGMLLLMSLVLALRGRRTEHYVLSAFLAVVGLNYVAIGFAILGSWDDSWLAVTLAAVTLAADPPLFLAFVLLSPFRSHERWAWRLLAVSAALGACAMVFALVAPKATVPGIPGIVGSMPLRDLTGVALMSLTYAAAWLVAAWKAGRAATPRLALQASWLLFAVGVVVVPRFVLLPLDLRTIVELRDMFMVWNPALGPGAAAFLGSLGAFAIGIPIMLLVFHAAARPLRRSGAPEPCLAALRRVGWVAALWTGAGMLAQVSHLMPLGWPNFALSFAYAFRWLLFAVAIVMALIVADSLEYHRTVRRAGPVVAGAAGAGAVALFTLGVLQAGGLPGATRVGLALATGVAAVVPSAKAGAYILAQAAIRTGTHGDGRRLALYRAAVEEEADDEADRAPRLADARSRFGIAPDEARLIELLVAEERRLDQGTGIGEEILPGVVVEEVLGEGASSTAYRARRWPGGKTVAVKVLHGAGQGRSFYNELRVLQRVRHPRLVGLLDARIDGPRIVLVLEHVEGAPLDRRLQEGVDDCARILRHVLEALEALHGAHWVHCDIKPANILVRSNGDAVLADLGIARRQRPDPLRTAEHLAGAARGVVGTLAYMAPEVVRGHEPGPRSDLYAVGLVAYECVTGRPALDLVGLGTAAAFERAGHPEIDLGRVPEAWRPFLRQALDPDPDARFRDAASMREALPMLGTPGGSARSSARHRAAAPPRRRAPGA